MIRALSFALFLLASAAAYAGQEPIDHPTQTEKGPPLAPTSIVIVACKVDDFTGQRPLPEGVMPAPGWRDLDLHVEHGELICQHVRLDLEDAVAMDYPRKPYALAGVVPESDSGLNDLKQQAPVTGSLYAEPLNPNFGDPAQCAHAGAMKGAEWNEHNKGWAFVGIGCPTRLGIDADGDGQPDFYRSGPLRGQYIIKGWKMPGCPDFFPGTKTRMKCRFDPSMI